ncbi:DNA polymerase/3'-5' exonuclease PolX [Rubritalea profundi]|uniref:DNA-directed DNA polymerase n=1 Tax=Rubritalea profundi TaxID=1658618 RepID=A0A2S7U720_9BACT|nr:DNA polymerase/3'-5' exonuclease PolX [Rubritalea profundi]PQJ30102.1 histidinol-phosphatase [Rubritalea profundi]
MDREDIADVLDQIALLLELKGENIFKTRAYRNGAEIVRSNDADIVALAKENKLDGIAGLGKALQQKIHELATTGKLEFYENLRAEFPPTLFDLFEIQGLGPKKIKALYDQLKIDSVESLKTACESGSISALKGFAKKTVEKILAAIELREKFASHFRLGDVAVMAETLLDHVRAHPATLRCCHAGSYRRSKEILHDIDILVATDRPAELTEYFSQLDEVAEVIVCGETKVSIRLDGGLQADLRAVSNSAFPFALQYFSGSKEHNVAIRQRALKRGWSLNEYDFTVKEGAEQPPVVHEEADIYQALGLDFIPPELRENRGEIEAAENGKIPRLIELENLRGTFHNHTTASDGRNSLEEMAEAAIELGLEYLGIADHSKASFQANGLYPDRLLRQVAEIKKLNQQWNGSFRLLAGSEVDILKDGTLDFADDILSQLDYVVASVHNSFTLPEKEMTARIIRAMENPHVTMLGHVTGRLLLRREAYAVNIDKIIDCAAATGTIIELNCNPRRLDMDWRHWNKAREKGVKCAINPDAHRLEQLQFLAFGVRLARKGWLSKSDVINTKALPEILDFLSIQ